MAAGRVYVDMLAYFAKQQKSFSPAKHLHIFQTMVDAANETLSSDARFVCAHSAATYAAAAFASGRRCSVRLPVLGFPSPTAQSTTSSTEAGCWGILGGRDIARSRTASLRRSLSCRLEQQSGIRNISGGSVALNCVDPYQGSYFDSVH